MSNDRTFKDSLLVLLGAAAVMAALLIKVDPSIFSLKQPGSFEYVRKGEQLLAAGKRHDAIREYEKALRASPQSERIASHAVWAYTECARASSAAGDEAQAIYYLARAHALRPGAMTARNLALAYARRALADARRGDLAKAVPLFAKARDVAARSTRAQEELAIYLYNDAVVSYRAGRDAEAAFSLQESLLVGESARALELLGDVRYRAGDLAEAGTRWKRALEIDAGSEELKRKVERIAKEEALARSVARAVAGHFEIIYDDRLIVDAAAATEALEKAYAAVGRELDFHPADRTMVYLYSEKDFRDIFKLPREVRAFYDGAIRIPLPADPPSGAEFARYIAHEYAHAAVSALTGGRFPVWFSEGIAVAAQVGSDERQALEMISRAGDVSAETIDTLDAAFAGDLHDRALVARYYVLAYTVVRFIRERFGDTAVRAIMARMKDGQHFVNAADDELLLSEQQFERQWREYIATLQKRVITKGADNG